MKVTGLFIEDDTAIGEVLTDLVIVYGCPVTTAGYLLSR